MKESTVYTLFPQELCCPCEYLGVLYKLVATHIVGIEIVLHDYFSLLVLFICNFLFLGAISLLKFLRITLKFDISVTKELKLCSERTRMLRQSVWIRISETYIDRAIQFEKSSKEEGLSLIHIWRCRRSTLCRSRWSPYH